MREEKNIKKYRSNGYKEPIVDILKFFGVKSSRAAFWTILIIASFASLVAYGSIGSTRGLAGLTVDDRGELQIAINPCGIPVDNVTVSDGFDFREYQFYFARSSYFTFSPEAEESRALYWSGDPKHIQYLVSYSVIRGYRRTFFPGDWPFAPSLYTKGSSFNTDFESLKEELKPGYVLVGNNDRGELREYDIPTAERKLMTLEEFQHCKATYRGLWLR
ncbi:hypothetical protein GP475_10560 [Corynebacterium poyangense]|uniref:Uncharacterized protein n=1 Tax=Corynebacterium poyangense TaxID=2684405 RepID=A0A7H0SR44_9CORY|nr:hypothetical protein [Corynebacterium poyangense]MBZ8176446.1 hypothetical protein [Corynebacterium poyangense]QNQ91019.1 hypothetical protein GP475_10560 [Corynebacterium poyangense]